MYPIYLCKQKMDTVYFKIINIEYSAFWFSIMIYIWQFMYSLNISSICDYHLGPHLPYSTVVTQSFQIFCNGSLTKVNLNTSVSGLVQNVNAPGTAWGSWHLFITLWQSYTQWSPLLPTFVMQRPQESICSPSFTPRLMQNQRGHNPGAPVFGKLLGGGFYFRYYAEHFLLPFMVI